MNGKRPTIRAGRRHQWLLSGVENATVRALWTELTRLARLGVAASMAYQQLTEVESNRQRLVLQREEIRLALADAGRQQERSAETG